MKKRVKKGDIEGKEGTSYIYNIHWKEVEKAKRRKIKESQS